MKIILKLKFVSFLLIIPLLGIISCKKANDNSDTCAAFKNYVPPGGWTVQNTYKAYGWPDFNPNNPNEFVYDEFSRADTASPYHYLCTYNMLTKQKKVLITSIFLYQPKWGSKDLIALINYSDNQVWVIKSDGSNLKKITNAPGYSYYFPCWSPNGLQLVFDVSKGGSGGNSRIIDTSGNIIKNFDTSFGGACVWMPIGTQIAGNYHGNPHIIDLNTNISTSIPYYVDRVFPDGNSWLTSNTNGVFVYHRNTNQLQKIKSNCGPVYSFFSISNDGEKIICARDISHVVDSQTILNENAIVIMNADGSNEHVVDIK